MLIASYALNDPLNSKNYAIKQSVQFLIANENEKEDAMTVMVITKYVTFHMLVLKTLHSLQRLKSKV